MRLLLFILFCNLAYSQVRSQEQPPPCNCTSKSLRPYYCPSYNVEVGHMLEGIGNLDKPIDSVSKNKFLITGSFLGFDEDDSLLTLVRNEKKDLSILVDTSLSGEAKVLFMKPYRLNRSYSSYPRQIRTIDAAGIEKVQRIKGDVWLKFRAQPVFLANLTDNVLYFSGSSGQLWLTQEAKDSNNNWVPIEINPEGGCGMVQYVCSLQPRDYALTYVLKFTGNYKTQLRIALQYGQRIIYSEPFAGSIDYKQISNPKVITIDEIYLYERL